MYKITAYTLARAKDLGVIVKPSSNKLKKIDVYKNGIKIASVGGIKQDGTPYMDYPTYIKTKGLEYANERRRLYLKRHSKEPKENKGVKTPSYWSDKLLW